MRVRGRSAATALRNPFLLQSLDALDDALRQASEATGGEAFIHATDLESVLARIDEAVGRFYLLSYEPLPPAEDGEYHEIRVEVDRQGVNVRARGGYVDTPVSERRRRSIEAALQLPGLATDLPTEAGAYLSWREDTAVALLAVAVDIATAGTRLEPTGERVSSLEFHFMVVRGDDIVTSGVQVIEFERAARQTRAANTDGSARPQREDRVYYQHELEIEDGLSGGDYDVRVAVFDRVSGRLGGAQFNLEIPPRPDGWHTSDIVLASVTPAGELRPVVNGELARDQSGVAYIEVYGGQRPVLQGRVFNADAPDDSQGADLFAVLLRPSGPDTHSGALMLPTGLPSGDYILQVQVTDTPADRHRILRVPISWRESR